MLTMVLAFGAGLVVGWNFIPQPAVVKMWVDRIFKRTQPPVTGE